MFKQGEILLGPVTSEKLTDLLFQGEIDGATPVSKHGEEMPFRPLRDVDAFKVHVAKAEAKLRVEGESSVVHKKERRGRLFRIVFIGLATTAALIGGGRAAWWLAIHRPWEKQIQLPDIVITDELPQIKLASARGADDFDYPGNTPGKVAGKDKLAKADKKGPNGKASAPASTTARRPNQTDEDGLESVQQWDQEGINNAVKAQKKSLHPCLMAEARRQKSGWEARVPIEFTIGNDGRVAKLWIDNPDFKAEGCELYKCMAAELKKWKFPSYAGEQANVSLAFSIKAP